MTNRIGIALSGILLALPGTAVLGEEDRGVVTASPAAPGDTITANTPAQDVIETPARAAPVERARPAPRVGESAGPVRRRTADDRGVVGASPAADGDTITANTPGQDVIETPGG